MRSNIAVLAGSFVIGMAIIGARFIAPYQIAAAVDGSGNPAIWRLNVVTGDVRFCPALNVIKDHNPFNKFDPERVEPCL